MAIGFFFNPQSPFQLGVELHRKLRIYNNGKPDRDIMGVRIGLSSGPVFIVKDIGDNQNVWGPGIILARRVMDIGDSFHILMAERLAEELIALQDEYRTAIRYVGDYQIKHSQRSYIRHFQEFGNPHPPVKVADQFSIEKPIVSENSSHMYIIYRGIVYSVWPFFYRP